MPEVTFVARDVGPVGGVEAALTALIAGLLDAGYHVTLVTRTSALAPHPRLRIMHVQSPVRPFPVAYVLFFLRGSIQVYRQRRGLVHTAGAIVGNSVDVSTMFHCHHAVYDRGRGRVPVGRSSLHRLSWTLSKPLRLWSERYCYQRKRPRALVADSAGVAIEIARYLPGAPKPRTIPLGVDSEHFRPDPAARVKIRAELGIEDGEPVALFVGGDWERKGLPIAIEAVALSPPWRLLVAGRGSISHYRRHAERAGATNRIMFVGTPPDVAPWYAAADAFVLPSAYETFSLPSFEAAACGLPLLVTRVNGVEELLKEGVNGWFIRRDPQDLARRLRQLVMAGAERATMARDSRMAAERWTWRRMVDDYLALYSELAGRSCCDTAGAQE
jgi:glycosyltransferase involved in cell wall biosynthesis